MISKAKFNRLLRFILMWMMLISPFSTWAIQPDSLFQTGNQAYAQNRIENAISSYQQLIKEGYQSAPLFYNLGNAYFKTGDMASALLYLEKAHKLAPGDAEINNNIEFVNSKITDKTEVVPTFFLYKWWRSVMLYFDLDSLAILSSTFLLLGFITLIIFVFSRNISLRKICFYSGLVLIIVGTSTVIISIKQNSYFNSNKQAIVFSSSVTAKSEPATTAKDLFVLHAGTKVNVLEYQQDWVKISLANGRIGWISASVAKAI